LTAPEVLAALRGRGVELSVAGDKLRYRAPLGSLDDDLRRAAREHRGELLLLLAWDETAVAAELGKTWPRSAPRGPRPGSREHRATCSPCSGSKSATTTPGTIHSYSALRNGSRRVSPAGDHSTNPDRVERNHPMSRGHGRTQRAILDALARATGAPLLPLGGDTRSERAALVRAAETLERAGLCVVVRLWNDRHTALDVFVGRPGATYDGKPVKELSVARVPHGTGATLSGSHRHIARKEKVSKTTVGRDLQKAAKIAKR
jgi:hypothetical protein